MPASSNRSTSAETLVHGICLLVFSALLFGILGHAERAPMWGHGMFPVIADETLVNGRSHLKHLGREVDPDQTGRGAFPVFHRERQIVMATLISDDGYFLTKASEFPSFAENRLDELFLEGGFRGRVPFRIVDRFRSFDLMLLHAEAPAQGAWQDHVVPAGSNSSDSGSELLERGAWVVSSRVAGKVALGVVGSPARPIPDAGPAVGIEMQETREGVRVGKVFENSAAHAAGIVHGDVVVEIDGNAIASSVQLGETVSQFQPGDSISMKVVREGVLHEFSLVLGDQSVFEDSFDRINKVSGRLSRRKTGFPAVVQHDTPLAWRDMGGPVFDLEGRWVGLNIARVNRLATYHLPVQTFWTETRAAVVRDRLRPIYPRSDLE